ncbi:MAG: phosphoglucosamine mutase, partial [Raoultibacter sp.]
MAQAIHFGTDGWRAIIGEDFTDENLARTIAAAARIFKEQRASDPALAGCDTLFVGHDCRLDAHSYSQLAASVAAAEGFTVKLSNDFCPTPCLCFSVARDPRAIGGIMLTSSHNPAEYLGVKLRMADGGASSQEFTDRVEAVLPDQAPTARGAFEEVDLITPYLEALKQRVDGEAI